MRTRDQKPARPEHVIAKEPPTMTSRLKRLALLLSAGLALGAFALPAVPAAAAPQPWWQVLTGSRPTNLWEPTDNVQEIKSKKSNLLGSEILAARIEVHGKIIGCLAAGSFFGLTPDEVCQLVGIAPEATETAEDLEHLLEGANAFGTASVEVTGGPAGGEPPFLVTTPGSPEPTIAISPLVNGLGTFGAARVKLRSPGGSGRLVLTITNLGDAPVDATKEPVTITDELPAGVEATGIEAFAGDKNRSGPVKCEIQAPDLVSCGFEGELPSYEAIEVEIGANLTGQPPAAGAPGTVSVSGGNAAPASESQAITVSPEPTPFGIEQFSGRSEEEGGAATTRAGSHPFQLTTTIQLNSGPVIGESKGRVLIEQPAIPRNLRFPLPAGLIGNNTMTARCPMSVFVTPQDLRFNECPASSAIGVASVTIIEKGNLGLERVAVPVFNLDPEYGEPARIGFLALGDPVIIDTEVDPDNHYRITGSVRNTTQLAEFLSSTVTLWGTPGDPRHDSSRGWYCTDDHEKHGACERPQNLDESAFWRQPASCSTPLNFQAIVEPWNVPLGSVIDSRESIQANMIACNQVPFGPSIAGSPTTKLAENPSGFDFRLDMPNAGLLNSEAVAEGQAKKVEFTLPEGMSVNPSEGEGLVGCSEAQYEAETAQSLPGEGCPNASKIGEVSVTTPLLKEEAHGALFIAAPHANPFGSLLGLYLVAKIPERGIVVKQAGKVEADPRTGQLTTIFDDLPQLPFSTFHLHFREGGRAPLVTPPACGTYQGQARFVPWSAQDPDNPAPGEVVSRKATFQIERGVDGGACPPNGAPPFHPGLLAGTINNAAGTFSNFNLRLTRNDGEQEFTHFSIKLPPGITGKLAGIPYCPDSAIAQARARTGIHGGQEELDQPSCPAASEIGRTLVGAGVGSLLTYVPGKLYLAGPYNGAPLSMVAITSGVVGPFDVGTVVIRQAFRIDPETAEVFIDATSSDPIPHIIQGIPVHARDIRAYVDRPNFTLNPTSCKRTSTASTVLGSGLDFASPADDNPITVTSPFQAADCAALSFDPKLSLQLLGGTKRGSHPAFKATLRMHGIGEAAIRRAQVTLPHSEFLENAHIKTICTRVQFKAGAGNGTQCPAGSVYGYAKATTPILSEPLTGPVFLRSSEHQLPDLVAALHSPTGIDFDLVGRIDSVKGGGIRNTFEAAPDAPVSTFTLTMRGGKKGLLVNSTDLCRGTHRAEVSFEAHNGKQKDFRPALKAKCAGKAKKKSKRAQQRRSAR